MIALQFPMSIAATRSAIGYWRWVMGYRQEKQNSDGIHPSFVVAKFKIEL